MDGSVRVQILAIAIRKSPNSWGLFVGRCGSSNELGTRRGQCGRCLLTRARLFIQGRLHRLEEACTTSLRPLRHAECRSLDQVSTSFGLPQHLGPNVCSLESVSADLRYIYFRAAMKFSFFSASFLPYLRLLDCKPQAILSLICHTQ